jgi:predicted transcriptional regulator
MIMQKSGKTKTIINAFGAPHIAVKYEAAIGKLMIEKAKRENHVGRIPQSTLADAGAVYYYKLSAEKNRERVLAALHETTLQTAREVARAAGMSRETAIAVMRRLKTNGEVVSIPRGNYHVYRLGNSCGTHHE